jgi:uncharacterized hydrophobic protein (TIGR00271 family)
MQEKNFFRELIEFLKLDYEAEDPIIVHESIEKGVVFKGTNLWILIFAILIASVGLNMNSTAVIIGAMLISPLMGPINGVGYSIATYNFQLFRKSMKNFGFSISAALVTSILYFLLTPIHGEHSELLSRTSPTIYDVLIASFGGLAGIVALTSKNKGNVIPGVAIATALMPPICTAGYGVANGNWSFFLGAMYLFVINSVFIALSSMVVTQILKFPKQTHLLSREIKNKNIAIIVVITLTVLPSLYLGYTLVVKEEFKQRAIEFVDKVSFWEGNYLLKYEIEPSKKAINLIYGGNEFDSTSIQRLYVKADDLQLKKVKLNVKQGLKLNDLSEIQSRDTELERMKSQLTTVQSSLMMRERSIDSLKAIPKLGERLLKEIKPMYPDIYSCSYSVSYRYVDSIPDPIPVQNVIFESDSTYQAGDRLKIKLWLKNRLPGNEVNLSL